MQLVKAKQLFAGAGQDFDALREAAKQKGFKAVPLTGVKASLSFDNSIAKKMSRNVIGVLPGTKRPDEYVLYTAHWDHLGRCAPVDGDRSEEHTSELQSLMRISYAVVCSTTTKEDTTT